MTYTLLRLSVVSLTLGVISALNTENVPSCPPSEPICRLQFTLSQIETMILYQGGRGVPIVYRDGVFKKRLSCFEFEDATPEELSQVNMADGLHKFVYGVNGEVPGPSVVVYDNQTLEVTVTNLQLHEGAGVHWHGIFQIGSPFMDGVPGVTQCGIQPMETFVYRFTPEPHGTHLYHSHMGVQRTDGVYGPLIVLPSVTDDTLPTFANDFTVLFHDWFPSTNIQDLHANQYGLSDYQVYGYNGSLCERHSASTLINGRGYHYVNGEPETPIPLTTYTVQQGQTYRFRLINSALQTAYKLHIDQHKLHVFESDGSRVTPVEGDYIVVHTGERYDVWIEANRPIDNYWIRVELVNSPTQPGLAVLRYEGAPEVLPTSSHTECSFLDPCEVINCPFESYSDPLLNFACINIGDLTSTGDLTYFSLPHHKEVVAHPAWRQVDEEHFMVFQSTADVNGNLKQSVNAIHYLPPSKPPQIHREVDFDLDCSQFDCVNAPCSCSHLDNIALGNSVQMTFVSADGGDGHPIHLHGHRFQVMKVVYGEGFGIHPDISCNSVDENRCTNPSWTDPSWSGGNVPDINEENPPEKDTVIVPRGGYVVVRFFAQNPGFWLLHCHMDFHFASGMGVILQEGDVTDMPAVPDGIAVCGSFRYETMSHGIDNHKKNTHLLAENSLEVLKKVSSENSESESGIHSSPCRRHIIGYIIAFIMGLMAAATILLVAMACRKKPNNPETIIVLPEKH